MATATATEVETMTRTVGDHLRIIDLSMIVGKSERTIRLWIAEGRLPKPMRLGRQLMWRRDEVQRWVDNGFTVAGQPS